MAAEKVQAVVYLEKRRLHHQWQQHLIKKTKMRGKNRGGRRIVHIRSGNRNYVAHKAEDTSKFVLFLFVRELVSFFCLFYWKDS